MVLYKPFLCLSVPGNYGWNIWIIRNSSLILTNKHICFYVSVIYWTAYGMGVHFQNIKPPWSTKRPLTTSAHPLLIIPPSSFHILLPFINSCPCKPKCLLLSYSCRVTSWHSEISTALCLLPRPCGHYVQYSRPLPDLHKSCVPVGGCWVSLTSALGKHTGTKGAEVGFCRWKIWSTNKADFICLCIGVFRCLYYHFELQY